MIRLTRLNGFEFVVNPELIEFIEAKPNTTLYFATGSKIVVQNTVDEVIQKIMDYRRTVHSEGKSSAELLLKTYRKEER